MFCNCSEVDCTALASLELPNGKVIAMHLLCKNPGETPRKRNLPNSILMLSWQKLQTEGFYIACLCKVKKAFSPYEHDENCPVEAVWRAARMTARINGTLKEKRDAPF